MNTDETRADPQPRPKSLPHYLLTLHVVITGTDAQDALDAAQSLLCEGADRVEVARGGEPVALDREDAYRDADLDELSREIRK
jgi:hypothetical protein